MKKFVVLLAVAAFTCLISSVAYAVDVTVGGELDIRSRDYTNLTLDKDISGGNERTTQERIRVDINAKASDDLKGKISIWNDYDDWGRLEVPMGQGAEVVSFETGTTTVSHGQQLAIREAWVSFNLPGLPINVTGGHQFIALGNMWFVRNLHFGDDAWVVANVTGNNTVAVADVKVAQPDTALADDLDFYALLDVYKINDNHTVGLNFANVKDRKSFALGSALSKGVDPANLYNIEAHYTGKLGPVALKAELDFQAGKAEKAAPGGEDVKFKGNQIVVQGNVAVEPVTINFAVARGSGTKENTVDQDKFINFLDIDQHYTLLYEYKVAGPCGTHTGFCNTTAFNVGANMNATKSLNVGVDLWFLQATEKVANVKSPGETTNSLGTEVDVNVNWKLYDNLSWNWTLALLKPGDGLGLDDATGVQGVLAYKF